MEKLYEFAEWPYRYSSQYRAIATGQYRCPKKWEYYLSGAIPQARIAPNDLSTQFYIAMPVMVKIEVKQNIYNFRWPYGKEIIQNQI